MQKPWKIIIVLLAGILLPIMLQGQTVSKSFKREPLKQVLEEIESQTGYSFAFEEGEIDLRTPVSANFKDTGIDEVLNRILDPSLKYTINGKLIAISKKETAPSPPLPAFKLTFAVSTNILLLYNIGADMRITLC